MSRGEPAYEFVDDVTSDLSFVARGDSLEDVFAACADALLAATVEEPTGLALIETHRLELEEPDLELLLLAFLNELVFLRDARGLLLRPGKLRVRRGDEARLECELVGEQIDPARHSLLAEVKAATAHGLRLVEETGGFSAQVTLDV